MPRFWLRAVLLKAPFLVALLVALSATPVRAAPTPPTFSESVAKPADLTITPPWGGGESHQIPSGGGYAPGGAFHFGRNCASPPIAVTRDCYALDFAGSFTVRAVAAGRVRYAGFTSGGFGTYGRVVYLSHGVFNTDRGRQEIYSFYAHLASIDSAISNNRTVAQGQPLGISGTSGCLAEDYWTTQGEGPHLHFAMHAGSRFSTANPSLVCGQQGGTGPHSGYAVVPEPMVQCSKDAARLPCEELRPGSTLTRTGTPEPPGTGTLQVAPLGGPAGSRLNASGANYPSNSAIRFLWDGTTFADERWRTNRNGSFEEQFPIPSGAAVGQHSLQAEVAGVRGPTINVQVTEPPVISIADTSVIEGNTGRVDAVFEVTLSAPSIAPVSVRYVTADGTATAASVDFFAVNSELTFSPGETRKTISIPINSDTIVEPNETFLVRLRNPTNATMARDRAVGTIVNDDGLPSISIADAAPVLEGNAGATAAAFQVTLTAPSAQQVTAAFATADGTATAVSGDYATTSGALTFTPGETSKTVSVSVNGDTVVEPDETFLVNLSNPTNATIARGQGVGTIVDDDNVRDSWTKISLLDAPSLRANYTSVWTGTEMILWGGSHIGFGDYLNDGGRYVPVTDRWSMVSSLGAPTPRISASAVWTGTEMIVWGGCENGCNYAWQKTADGGRYDPTTNSWAPLGTSNAPSPRSHHQAFWNGSEMIVWGGQGPTDPNLLDGARYNPRTERWTAIPPAPLDPRTTTAVWAGTDLIVWGGWNGSLVGTPGVKGDGARFNLATNTWTLIPEIAANYALAGPTAVWTGSEMIVWGGCEYPSGTPFSSSSCTLVSTGARYNPSTNRWLAIATPTLTPRMDPVAVWTGSEMIVWGGLGGDLCGPYSACSDGARYEPVSNTWRPVGGVNAPSPRWQERVLWTGTEMIIWGGAGSPPLWDGARYSP